MQNWFSYHWLKLLAIIFVLGALGTFPYAYYQFMNWIVTGAALVTSMQAHQQGKTAAMWLFIFVAVVFNPLAPLYLRADVWDVADLVAALLFLIAILTIRPSRAKVRTA
jgi:hypothetical protein